MTGEALFYELCDREGGSMQKQRAIENVSWLVSQYNLQVTANIMLAAVLYNLQVTANIMLAAADQKSFLYCRWQSCGGGQQDKMKTISYKTDLALLNPRLLLPLVQISQPSRIA